MMKEIKQYTISFEELKSTLLLVVNKKNPHKRYSWGSQTTAYSTCSKRSTHQYAVIKVIC
jgi:hypothetical protein